MSTLGNVLGINVLATSTSQQHAIGHRVGPDGNGRHYVYGPFKAATTKGQPVAWKYTASTNTFITTYASGLAGSVAGVAMASAVAAGAYGWVQSHGLNYRNIPCTGTCGANTRLIWAETGKVTSVTTTGVAGNWCVLSIAAKSGTVLVAGRAFVRGLG